jgi:hypothetical protein
MVEKSGRSAFGASAHTWRRRRGAPRRGESSCTSCHPHFVAGERAAYGVKRFPNWRGWVSWEDGEDSRGASVNTANHTRGLRRGRVRTCCALSARNRSIAAFRSPAVRGRSRMCGRSAPCESSGGVLRTRPACKVTRGKRTRLSLVGRHALRYYRAWNSIDTRGVFS